MIATRYIVCIVLLGISVAGLAINQIINQFKIAELEERLQQLQQQLEQLQKRQIEK